MASPSDDAPVFQHRFEPRPTCFERLWDATLLAVAISIPLLGHFMSTSGDAVAFPGFERSPLPNLCVSRAFGIRCATCGVTRSIIALMHGDLSASLAYHRFGWLILLFVIAQVPFRTYRLLRPRDCLPRLERVGILALMAVAILVVINRFVEFVAGQ